MVPLLISQQRCSKDLSNKEFLGRSSLFIPQVNPVLTPTRAFAAWRISVPLLTPAGNLQKESPLRPSSSEGAGLKVSWNPSIHLFLCLWEGRGTSVPEKNA